MFHLWIIALFLTIIVHDSVGAIDPLWTLSDQQIAAVSLLPMLWLILVLWLAMVGFSRRLEQSGSIRSVFGADRALGASRWIAVVLNALNVFVFGWPDAVRRVTGDVIMLDELITIMPAVVVFIAGWWAWYPIERTLRDAAIIGAMDSGGPVYPTPTRRQFVALNVRHQLLPMFVPALLILGWTEAVGFVFDVYLPVEGPGRGGLSEDLRDALGIAGQLAGVAVVFFAAPVVLKMVWDTARLAPGDTRDRLVAMCRAQGVKVRDILVWRTHGSMCNGAVIGMLGPLRYILLTDALLDCLSDREVEAVMAHEVAHVRHRHMPWLALSMLASVGVFAVAASFLAGAAGVAEATGDRPTAIGWLIAGAALGSGLVTFGFVSRRFEWQSDAFAVQHLSGARRCAAADGPLASAAVIAPAAVLAMAAALGSVARLNHISPDKFSWRHGSIASRITRLEQLRGKRSDELSIDRTVRSIKAMTLVVFFALVLISAARAWRGVGL